MSRRSNTPASGAKVIKVSSRSSIYFLLGEKCFLFLVNPIGY
jgi:hypothetical protein